MREKIERIAVRHLKKADDDVGKQKIRVWQIEEEGEEETEHWANWTVIYYAAGLGREREFEILQVLDENEQEVDYEAQGYSADEIEKLVAEASKPEPDKEGIVKKVRDHHKTIVERGSGILALRRLAAHLRTHES